MRRGDLVTVAARASYAGKPRPAVIVQSDAFPIASVTLCLITTELVVSDLRIELEPDEINNLGQRSWIMIDKVLTVPRRQIGKVFGRLRADEISRLNWGLAVFLDIGGGLLART